jgi:hypothetical protein
VPKKTSDPKLIALKDEAAKAAADCERWYSRLKRAFNRLEKARRRLARLQRRVEAHGSAPPAGRGRPGAAEGHAGPLIDLAALAAGRP